MRRPPSSTLFPSTTLFRSNPSRQGTPMALTDRRDDSPPVQGGGTGLRFVQGVGRDGAFGKGGRGGEASLAATAEDGMPARPRPMNTLSTSSRVTQPGSLSA